MIRSTLISRVSNSLPLSEFVDDASLQKDFPDYKNQTKAIIKSLSSSSEPKCTIESGPFNFHYFLEQDIVYLCLTDKYFPKRLAFSFLDEVSREFLKKYGKEVQSAQRPYAFIQFDTIIRNIEKNYKDSRNQQNLTKLNEELQNVTRIMTKNIQDVMQRGEKMDKLSTISSHLTLESKRYASDARNLNLQLLYQKYSTLVIFIIIIIVLYYLWSSW